MSGSYETDESASGEWQTGEVILETPEAEATTSSLYASLGDRALSLLIDTDEEDRSNEVFRLQRNPDTYEVTIDSNVTLDDYRRVTRPEDWVLLERWAEPMRNKTVVFINPTMAGGGVAMMRPPIVHLARLLGVDSHWFTMEGKLKVIDEQDASNIRNPFIFTKHMHNIIQRRSSHRVSSDGEGRETHQKWNSENADVLERQASIKGADVIIIDDPQPVPLIPRLKKINPKVKIIWRNHIDNDADLMSNPSEPQGEVMDYLWESGLKLADAYVYHPDVHDKFVPHHMRDKAYLAPATVEPYDDMNRELSDEEVKVGLATINREIADENQTLELAGQYEDMQDLIDPERDRFVLIARFDESKGMDKMMELGARVREEVLRKRQDAGLPNRRSPQIVIIGNGSVDDPSGVPMLEGMRQLRREYPEDVRQDIILKRLKHNYMAINAAMYNQSETAVLVAAQMSDAEGCETRITDWIRHGIPVVVANRGGMPLQVIEGESGIVLDYDTPDRDFARGTEYVSNLMVNHEAYEVVRENTRLASRTYNEREYMTIANRIRWFRIINNVLNNQSPDKLWKISDLSET